ncbi:MAG: SDR family NAD(P)-dependent oxidoreductase [Rheinheimera sp.]
MTVPTAITGEHAPVSLVTGASRGIGAASALRLAALGHHLLLTARNEIALTDIAQQCQLAGAASTLVLPCDLTDQASVMQLFNQIKQQHQKLDHLINAAGMMQDSMLGMTRLSDLQALFSLNVMASYQCCQLAARLMMRQKQGNIVNLASKVGESGAIGQSAYAASKAAISGLTKALAKELGPFGIRVNAVAPGFIETDLTAHYSDAQKQQLCQQISLGRTGQADEVAAVIQFLCSTDASYISGQVMAVDGGFSV